VLDVVFETRSGADLFDVDVEPAEWTTSRNWVGPPEEIAHEAHHLLGLDDRYDYIETHADNADLAISDRLYWFRQQMDRPLDPQGARSMMGAGSSLLDDDVCNVAGLDAAGCTAARRAGASRAAAAASPAAAGEMVTTGLCLKSFFGGELTFGGLSAGVLSDIAVINEDAGLTMSVANGTTYDADGFWYRFRPSQWFKVPDHCAVNVTAPPHTAGFYEQCCNLAASLAVDDPHWSTAALGADKRNPFS
jgi:hypothetical protein